MAKLYDRLLDILQKGSFSNKRYTLSKVSHPVEGRMFFYKKI